MAATAGQIAVDGGGDQRWEVAGDEEDNPETRRGRAGYARAKGFKKNRTRSHRFAIFGQTENACAMA